MIYCKALGRSSWGQFTHKSPINVCLSQDENSGSSFSGIDPNEIDLMAHPNVGKVPWTYATLRPGDCIYIPAEYIHQVRSYNRTISATILFTSGPLVGAPFEPNGCDNNTMGYTALSDVNVHWTYNKGDAFIEMGYMNIEVLRHSILATMRERNEENLTKAVFVDFWEQQEEKPFEYFEDNIYEDPRVIFDHHLDVEGKGVVTKDEILHFSKQTLKTLARLVDTPHGPQAKQELNSTMKGKEVTHEEL